MLGCKGEQGCFCFLDSWEAQVMGGYEVKSYQVTVNWLQSESKAFFFWSVCASPGGCAVPRTFIH